MRKKILRFLVSLLFINALVLPLGTVAYGAESAATASGAKSTSKADAAETPEKKLHFLKDGSIDLSYYTLEIMDSTMKDYQIPPELQYTPDNPLVNQMKRDKNGNLWLYTEKDTWAVFVSNTPKKTHVGMVYVTAMFDYSIPAKQWYQSGSPAHGTYKIGKDNRLYMFIEGFNWIPVGPINTIVTVAP